MSDLFPSGEILKRGSYFAITIGSDDKETWWSSTQTYWIGFADDAHRIELRKIRPVVPDRMADFWTDFGQPFCVVNDDRECARWMLGGGHALFTEKQTRKHLPQEMEPRKCVCEGAYGFTDLKKLPTTAFQKAPTPKLRMAVLKRDKYRCMICGQRPADDVNIQLQAHHIRPYGQRGVTTDRNLISLCHTCHAGLEPHFDCDLFELIEEKAEDSAGGITRKLLQEYIESVQRYRMMIKSLFC
jgi:hypothetical protein